jgi:glutamate carboxypeptidase
MAELPPSQRGAADSSFVAADADVLGGLGAAGGGAHAPGEYIELDSIARSAVRAALLMTRLSRTRR